MKTLFQRSNKNFSKKKHPLKTKVVQTHQRCPSAWKSKGRWSLIRLLQTKMTSDQIHVRSNLSQNRSRCARNNLIRYYYSARINHLGWLKFFNFIKIKVFGTISSKMIRLSESCRNKKKCKNDEKVICIVYHCWTGARFCLKSCT